jgi:homoserine kinase
MIGGLTTSIMDGEALIYRALPTSGLQVIVALPELDRYASSVAKVKPERVPLADAVHNLSRVPLLVEALRAGDVQLIGQILDDRLHVPYLKPHIAGYDHVAEMARRAGATAVTLSGDGPAVIAFAEHDHKTIATVMELAFENSGVTAHVYILPIDTQGVVISVAGSV